MEKTSHFHTFTTIQGVFLEGGVYFGPPYHLNPIRREIAYRYKFEDINYSEDIDWAMRICRDGLYSLYRGIILL